MKFKNVCIVCAAMAAVVGCVMYLIKKEEKMLCNSVPEPNFGAVSAAAKDNAKDPFPEDGIPTDAERAAAVAGTSKYSADFAED